MTTLRAKSQVTQVRAAPPEEATTHFAAKLKLEADPADVNYDRQNGVDNFVIVDARSSQQFEECHVPGAVSMPYRTVSKESTAHLDKDKLIVTYCWGSACNAATKAALKFAELGFPVKEMIGGIEYWRREGFAVEGSLGDDAPLVG